MSVRFYKLAAVTVLALAALASCSRSDAPGGSAEIEMLSGGKPGTDVAQNTSWVRAEFLKAEAGNTPMGDLFVALRTGQPELYEQFVTIAGAEISKGRSLFEAGAAARPVYLARFLELIKTAGDDDINEMLSLSHDQLIEAMKIDPMMCVKLTRGEADERVSSLPKEMTDRELVLMAHVLRSGEQSAAAASAEEVSTWMSDFVGKHPEIVEGLQLLSLPAPAPDQARAICQANITLLEGFTAVESTQRAKMYRGVLAMG